MDPWASNEWAESSSSSSSPKQRNLILEDEIDLKSSLGIEPSISNLVGHPTWPVPDISLPNWDTPSTHDEQDNKQVNLSSNSSSSDKPYKEETSSSSPFPSWSNPLTSSALNQSETDSSNIATIKSDGSRPEPLNFRSSIPSSSIDSDSDDFRTPEESNFKLPQEFPAADENHDDDRPTDVLSQPEMTPKADEFKPKQDQEEEEDDDRWGTFTHPPVLTATSLGLFKSDNLPTTQSTLQDGWQPNTDLGGWNHEASSSHHHPSLFPESSSSSDIPEYQYGVEKSWPSPTADGPEEEQSAEDLGEDAWADSKPRATFEAPSEEVGKQQVAVRRWAEDQYSFREEDFLPPGKAAMPLDLSSALAPGGELSHTLADLTKDPLPEKSETRTQLLFQKSATAEAFQQAMTNTASAAANVLKSAKQSRRFFNTGNTTSVSLTNAPSTAFETQESSSDRVWEDFSTLEVPEHPHDSNLDAFGSDDYQQAARQPETKKTGFFGLWAAKSPPMTNTPSSILSKKPESNSMCEDLPKSELSRRDSMSQQSHEKSKGSISGSPLSPLGTTASSESQGEQAPSRMSRLMGSLRPWSKSGMKSANPSTDLSNHSTELSVEDINFLDSVKTVPIDSQHSTLYDDLDGLDSKISKGYKDVKRSSEDHRFEDLFSDEQDVKKPVSKSAYRKNRSDSTARLNPRNISDPFDFLGTMMSSDKEMNGVKQENGGGKVNLMGGGMSGLPSVRNTNVGVNESGSSAHRVDYKKSETEQTLDDLDDLFSEFQSSVDVSSREKKMIGTKNKIEDEMMNEGRIKQKGWIGYEDKKMNRTMISNGIEANRNRMNSYDRNLTIGMNPIRMIETNRESIGSINKVERNKLIPILSPPPPPAAAAAAPTSGATLMKIKNSSTNCIPIIPPPISSSSTFTTTFNKTLMDPSHQSFNDSNSPLVLPTTSTNTDTTNSSFNGLSKQDLNFFDSLI